VKLRPGTRAQLLETCLVAEQNGAQRVDRLIGIIRVRIVGNPAKTRLRDTVLEAEEDFVGVALRLFRELSTVKAR
jgi:hypothetical protein